MKNTLRKQILSILKEFPKSRDSDQWLTLKIWAVFYSSKIKEDTLGKYVYLNDILALPREDDIKRIRAKIQNIEHLYLPTTLEVARKRRMKEEIYHRYFSQEYKRI